MFLLLYLLNNAMVKSTEREGSGLFGGGMPSVLTEGKHVPLSQLKTFTMIRTVTTSYSGGTVTTDTKGTTKHRRFT